MENTTKATKLYVYQIMVNFKMTGVILKFSPNFSVNVLEKKYLKSVKKKIKIKIIIIIITFIHTVVLKANFRISILRFFFIKDMIL